MKLRKTIRTTTAYLLAILLIASLTVCNIQSVYATESQQEPRSVADGIYRVTTEFEGGYSIAPKVATWNGTSTSGPSSAVVPVGTEFYVHFTSDGNYAYWYTSGNYYRISDIDMNKCTLVSSTGYMVNGSALAVGDFVKINSSYANNVSSHFEQIEPSIFVSGMMDNGYSRSNITGVIAYGLIYRVTALCGYSVELTIADEYKYGDDGIFIGDAANLDISTNYLTKTKAPEIVMQSGSYSFDSDVTLTYNNSSRGTCTIPSGKVLYFETEFPITVSPSSRLTFRYDGVGTVAGADASHINFISTDMSYFGSFRTGDTVYINPDTLYDYNYNALADNAKTFLGANYADRIYSEKFIVLKSMNDYAELKWVEPNTNYIIDINMKNLVPNNKCVSGTYRAISDVTLKYPDYEDSDEVTIPANTLFYIGENKLITEDDPVCVYYNRGIGYLDINEFKKLSYVNDSVIRYSDLKPGDFVRVKEPYQTSYAGVSLSYTWKNFFKDDITGSYDEGVKQATFFVEKAFNDYVKISWQIAGSGFNVELSVDEIAKITDATFVTTQDINADYERIIYDDLTTVTEVIPAGTELFVSFPNDFTSSDSVRIYYNGIGTIASGTNIRYLGYVSDETHYNGTFRKGNTVQLYQDALNDYDATMQGNLISAAQKCFGPDYQQKLYSSEFRILKTFNDYANISCIDSDISLTAEVNISSLKLVNANTDADDSDTDSTGNSDTDTHKPILLGDADQDGLIKMLDVTLIQRFIAELDTLTTAQKISADVDCDANVKMTDVILIQQYISGLITTFPLSGDVNFGSVSPNIQRM